MPKNSGAEEAKRNSAKLIACSRAVRNPCLKGNIDRSKSALVEQTRYMCIFFVLNAGNTRNAFCKTHAVRHSCLKGSIDRSKSALVETDKI